MQNRPLRPTLKHSTVTTLICMRNRDNTVFSNMPFEVICKMSGYSLEDNLCDFDTGLHYIAFGKLDELEALLELKPFLVLHTGKGHSVLTPRGTIIKNKSFYECAIGEGDPDIKALIESCYLQVKGGEEIMKAQFERYLPHIQSMPCKKFDDLRWLFQVLINSPLEDVAAELKTGEEYDWDYCSELRKGSYRKGSDLRDAMDKFREDELNSADRCIDQPGMHYNDQSIVHVYDLIAQHENDLIVGNNYDKLRLACRQMLGFKQLLKFTAYDRIVFASDQSEEAISGKKINRKNGFNYKHDKENAFPCFNLDLVGSHTGLGFGFYISLYGGADVRRHGRGRSVLGFKTYVKQKQQAWEPYAATASPSRADKMCNVLK
jgi:hypothetical protein